MATRVTSESLQFKNLAKVQLSLDNSSFESPNNAYSIICCSNKYGYTYVGSDNKLLIYDSIKTESNFNDESETNFGDDLSCNSSLYLSIELSEHTQIDSNNNIVQLSLSHSERYLAIITYCDSSTETKVFVLHLEKSLLASQKSNSIKEAFTELLSFTILDENNIVPSLYLSWNKCDDDKLAISKSQPISEIILYSAPFTSSHITVTFPEISSSDSSSSQLVALDWCPVLSNIMVVAIDNSLKIYKNNICVGSSVKPLLRSNDEYGELHT